jgi:hypothetical protein
MEAAEFMDADQTAAEPPPPPAALPADACEPMDAALSVDAAEPPPPPADASEPMDAALPADAAAPLQPPADAAAPLPPPSLLPSQVPHAARLLALLRDRPFALDLSALGSGKTWTATHVALDRERAFAHVVVVAPVSVLPKWRAMQAAHGLPLRHAVSFCTLRSTKYHQPAHGLLRRRDYKVAVHFAQRGTLDVDKVEFAPTQRLRQLVAQGLLVVVDEMQNLKNVTSQFAACQALLRPVMEDALAGGASRALLLSGSPIDKQEQAVTLLRALHVMRQDELARFNLATRVVEWLGMEEVRAFCARLDAPATARIVASTTAGTQDVTLRRCAYQLFQQVIKPAVSSSMPPPPIAARIRKLNAFYRVEDAVERRRMLDAVAALEEACGYSRETGTVNFATTGGDRGVGAIRAVTLAMLRLETAKIGTFERVARAALLADDSRKVVVFLNYTVTLRDLQRLLAEFRPLVLNGAVSEDARRAVLERFQAPDATHRLLLGNVAVCSAGIDLDDKHGGFPRLALVSPNYSTIALYQLGHRFQRMHTRSDTTLHMVFAAHRHERAVLDALARKGDVMKETTPDQVAAGVCFPGDLPRWYEHAEDAEAAAERERHRAMALAQRVARRVARRRITPG